MAPNREAKNFAIEIIAWGEKKNKKGEKRIVFIIVDSCEVITIV